MVINWVKLPLSSGGWVGCGRDELWVGHGGKKFIHGAPCPVSYHRVRVMAVFNSSAPAGHWTETVWNNKCSCRVDGILKLCLFSFCYLIYLKVDKTFICNWVLPPFSHVNVESCLLITVQELVRHKILNGILWGVYIYFNGIWVIWFIILDF